MRNLACRYLCLAHALSCSFADQPGESQGEGVPAIDRGTTTELDWGTDLASFDPVESGEVELEGAGGDGNPDTNPCVSPDGRYGEDISIIWIANSPEGTISKVDTRGAVELARYRTGPTGDESPSRTSVNLFGDVAVANRGDGSIVKIAAREENCVDRDGDGRVRTSRGPDDVLAWGEDECVLWVHQLDFIAQEDEGTIGGPRALAWEPGEQSLIPAVAMLGSGSDGAVG